MAGGIGAFALAKKSVDGNRRAVMKSKQKIREARETDIEERSRLQGEKL